MRRTVLVPNKRILVLWRVPRISLRLFRASISPHLPSFRNSRCDPQEIPRSWLIKYKRAKSRKRCSRKFINIATLRSSRLTIPPLIEEPLSRFTLLVRLSSSVKTFFPTFIGQGMAKCFGIETGGNGSILKCSTSVPAAEMGHLEAGTRGTSQVSSSGSALEPGET